jgi:acetyl-CoA carboxylase carboxyltransferase component
LIFLSDIPGLFPGKEAERKKLPGKIMVWHEARALASVPKISITIRKGYGMGWNCMLSPGEGGDFIVAWPTASISFVDPEIGIELVHGAKLNQMKNAEAERERLRKQWAIDSTPWAAAEKNFLQDVIDPRDTRKFLAEALEIIRGERSPVISEHRLQTWPTVF